MSIDGRSGGSWRRGLLAFLAVSAGSVLVLAMLGTQVSGILSTVGASVGGGSYGDGIAGDEAGGDPTGGDGSGSDQGGSSGAADGVIDGAPRDDLLIIKTGELRLQVDAIGAALTEVTQRVDQLGGFTSGS
jgi:hypothetical protein